MGSVSNWNDTFCNGSSNKCLQLQHTPDITQVHYHLRSSDSKYGGVNLVAKESYSYGECRCVSGEDSTERNRSLYTKLKVRGGLGLFVPQGAE